MEAQFNFEKFKTYLEENIIPSVNHYNYQKNEFIRIYNKYISVESPQFDPKDNTFVQKFVNQYAYYVNSEEDKFRNAISWLGKEITKRENPNETIKNDSPIPVLEPVLEPLNNGTPYLLDVWDKMIQLCELMQIKIGTPTSSDVVQPDVEKAKDLLLANIINKKFTLAQEEAVKKAIKLSQRVNYVMGVITYNMTHFVYDSSNKIDNMTDFMKMFSEEGIDIFDFKELAECIKDSTCPDGKSAEQFIDDEYKIAMKGAAFKVKVMTRNNKELRLKQKPYNSEITSYKLAKDAYTIFNKYANDTSRRNVRISTQTSNVQAQATIITTKKAWYMFSKINEMLTHVQTFFTYVKGMYANTTISVRNHLDMIYTTEEAQLVFQKKQNKDVDESKLVIYTLISEVSNKLNIPINSLETEMKNRMKVLSDQMFSRLAARLYSGANEFITKIIECKDIEQSDIDQFNAVINTITDDLTKTLKVLLEEKTGGGWIKNFINKTVDLIDDKILDPMDRGIQGAIDQIESPVLLRMVNGCIDLKNGVKQLTSLVQKTIGQIMRFLSDFNPIVAFILNGLLIGATCALTGVAAASGNIPLAIGMGRYCAMAVYLVKFTSQNMEGKIKLIQDKMGAYMNTTDVIMMIMQYGSFKELHETLLTEIGKIINYDGTLEAAFEQFKGKMNMVLLTIKSSANPISSFSEENMFTFHKRLRNKLYEIIATGNNVDANGTIDVHTIMSNLKASNKNKYNALQYFLKNVPSTGDDLRKAITIMVGDVSIDTRLFPNYFKNVEQIEMNYQVTSKIAESDIRKFILICMKETFETNWEMPEDIKIFKYWMKGQNISCFLNKKKKNAICPVQKVVKLLKHNDDEQKTNTVLLDVISDLTFIEKVSEPQVIFTNLRCRICEKAIKSMYDKYRNDNDFDNRISNYVAAKNGEVSTFKKIIQEISGLINLMDKKIKDPNYTIFLLGSKSQFDDIKKEALNDLFKAKNIKQNQQQSFGEIEGTVLTQAKGTSIVNVDQYKQGSFEILAQLSLIAAFL